MLLIFLVFSSVTAQNSAVIQVVVERQSSAIGAVKLKSLTQATMDCSSGCQATWAIGTAATVEVEGLDPITTIAMFNIGATQQSCTNNLAATTCSFTVQPLLEQNTVKVTLSKPDYASVVILGGVDQNILDVEPDHTYNATVNYTDNLGQAQTKQCAARYGSYHCDIYAKPGTGIDIQLAFNGTLLENKGWGGCDTSSGTSCSVVTRAAGQSVTYYLYRKRGNINFNLLGSPQQSISVNVKNLRTNYAFDQTFERTSTGTYLLKNLGTDNYLLTVTQFSVPNCTSTISSSSSNVTVASAATVDTSFTVQSDKCKLVINAVNGHVVSDPAGLVDCNGSCEVFLTPGVYSLVASPNAGFAFTNWQKFWFVPKFNDVRVPPFGTGIPYTATFATATPGNADLQLTYTDSDKSFKIKYEQKRDSTQPSTSSD